MKHRVYFLLIILLSLAGCIPSGSIPVATPEATSQSNLTPQEVQQLFTPEERAWLAQHPALRMGVEQNFPPYEFTDENGNFAGISSDYRDLISDLLGVNLQVETYPDFASVREKIKNKELDVVLLLTPTDERKQFLRFTKPFFDYQLVIVTQDDYPVVFRLDEFNDKTVAVVDGYASAEYIAKNYPELNIETYPTVEDGLMAVSTGKADAFVNEVFATVYQIRDKSIGNVKIAASLDTDLPGYAIAVRDDWPELVGILDKTLNAISQEERLNISEKWLSVKFEQGFDYSLFWKVLLGGAIVLAGFLYWNRSLSKEVTQRKRAEDELRKYQTNLEQLVKERTADLEAKNIALAAEINERIRAQEELKESEANFRALAENASDAIIITSADDNEILFANPKAEELTGYSTAEFERIGIAGLQTEQEYESSRRAAQERLAPIHIETRLLHKDSSEIPVEITSDQIHWHRQLATLTSARDITDRKKREAEIMQQKYELEVLTDLSAALRQIDKPADMASVALSRIIELLQMDCGSLAVLDGERLVFLAEQSMPTSSPCYADSLKDEIQRKYRNGEPVYSSDIDLVQDTELSSITGVNSSSRSYAIIPLKSFDTTIGILAVFSHEPREFPSQIRSLAAAIADIAGYAIERRRTMTTLEERVTDRTRDLSALYQVMSVANQNIEIHQILEQALSLALQAVYCSSGAIYLLDGDKANIKLAVNSQPEDRRLSEFLEKCILPNFSQDIINHNTPLVVADLTIDPRIPHQERGQISGELIGVPLHTSGNVLGILWGYSDQPGHLTLEDVSLLVTIGERIGTTIENFRLRERTQTLAILEERQRLARDLHDSVTQQIYSLLLFAGGAKKAVQTTDPVSSLQLLKRIEEVSRQALKELRLLIYELRPLDLQQAGLIKALQQRLESVEQRAGIQARLLASEEVRLPFSVEEDLFRMTIEALNNSLKHAAATEVLVRIQPLNGAVELVVADNGKGFDLNAESAGGSGLHNMQQRARKIGAHLNIKSSPGNGTSITILVEASDE